MIPAPIQKFVAGNFHIVQNFGCDSASKVFTFMVRNNCGSAIGMTKKFMAAFLPNLDESLMGKKFNQ